MILKCKVLDYKVTQQKLMTLFFVCTVFLHKVVTLSIKKRFVNVVYVFNFFLILHLHVENASM